LEEAGKQGSSLGRQAPVKKKGIPKDGLERGKDGETQLSKKSQPRQRRRPHSWLADVTDGSEGGGRTNNTLVGEKRKTGVQATKKNR